TSAEEEVHRLVAGEPELALNCGTALSDRDAVGALLRHDHALRESRLDKGDVVDILIGNTDTPSAVGVGLHLRGVAAALDDDDDILERITLILDVAAEDEVVLIGTDLVGNRGSRRHSSEGESRENRRKQGTNKERRSSF